MTEASPLKIAAMRLTARALIVGERINTAGLERPDTIASLPLAFRVGENGMVALFRFGVAVLVGLTPLEEEDRLTKLQARVSGQRARGDDETAVLEIAPDVDEQKASGGAIQIRISRRSAFSSSPTRWRRPWRWRATSARSTRCST